MDLSKLALPIYDLLALLVPGLALLAVIAFTSLGWTNFVVAVAALNGSLITGVLLTGFAFGHLVQQFSESVVKLFVTERFFKRSRDEVWNGTDGELLRAAIKADGGSVADADKAFAFCLSRVQSTFLKRDIFLVTSDFCRGMAAIALLALAPVARTAYDHRTSFHSVLLWAFTGFLASASTMTLFWLRMLKFRAYSEWPVFYAYLAQRSQPKQKSASGISST